MLFAGQTTRYLWNFCFLSKINRLCERETENIIVTCTHSEQQKSKLYWNQASSPLTSSVANLIEKELQNRGFHILLDAIETAFSKFLTAL